MEQDVVKMEAGLSYKKLSNIEKRLTGVESTLQELIENNDEMKEEIKEKLSDVKIEMENNTRQVKRMQRNYQMKQANSRYLFCFMIVGLIIWTIFIHWFKLR